MAHDEENHDPRMRALIDELDQLRHFSGSPAEFWPAYLEKSAQLVGARFGLLLGPGTNQSGWKKLAHTEQGLAEMRASGLESKIEGVARASLSAGSAWNSNGDGSLVGVRLRLDAEHRAVAVFFVDSDAELGIEEASARLGLTADTPSIYQLERITDQARQDAGKFSEGMDLMVLLNEQKRYLAAAMTFCNEIASRRQADRVTLGWLTGNYVRLQAISHMEKFEKKMDVVQELEALMEEALDQDEEIVWPRPEGSETVTRNHESFSRREGSAYIVSIPIRLDGGPVAVLTCERSMEAFSESTVRSLRLLCDLAARRLGDLKMQDRWIGARMATALREQAGRLLGVEHTFAKIAVLLVIALLAFGIFGRLSYRVQTPFILKSDDVLYVSAPFDGFISDVFVEVGDVVEQGDPLLRFDTRELLLQEADGIANRIRYQREGERARGERAHADQLIAEAMAEQAQAQLELVRHYLGQAEIRAPFRGVIVEGDLRELRGTPSRKGDALFRIARTVNLYAELDIDERDVHEVTPGLTGEIAFVSRPDLAFPIEVRKTYPIAVTREERNVVLARAALPETAETWWRPGMTGVAKIDVGSRNVLWILAHRTADFLRIYFWW